MSDNKKLGDKLTAETKVAISDICTLCLNENLNEDLMLSFSLSGYVEWMEVTVAYKHYAIKIYERRVDLCNDEGVQEHVEQIKQDLILLITRKFVFSAKADIERIVPVIETPKPEAIF